MMGEVSGRRRYIARKPAQPQNYIHEPKLLRQHSNAQYGRGVCAESLGLVDEAAACQRKVLELEPRTKVQPSTYRTRRGLGGKVQMRTQLKDPGHSTDSTAGIMCGAKTLARRIDTLLVSR